MHQCHLCRSRLEPAALIRLRCNPSAVQDTSRQRSLESCHRLRFSKRLDVFQEMHVMWLCKPSCPVRQLRPGYLSPSAGLKFADIPNGLAAVSKVPVAGWAQIAAYFGFVEFSGGFDDYKSGTPGDYGFKVLTSSDPAERTKKLSAELANGRLAMMAIIGMFFQDGLKVSQQHLLGAKARPVSLITLGEV